MIQKREKKNLVLETSGGIPPWNPRACWAFEKAGPIRSSRGVPVTEIRRPAIISGYGNSVLRKFRSPEIPDSENRFFRIVIVIEESSFRSPDFGVRKLQKVKKKWKLTTFFQKMPINDQFLEKVHFSTFPAYRMRKKGSENLKTKGGTLEVFCDFGHFRDLMFY